MATSKKRTAEIQAGFVVVLALAILAGGLYFVDGGAAQFLPKTKYSFHFANAGGLSDGNDVLLDGRKVGKVKLVRAALESESPAVILGVTCGNFAFVQAEIFKTERIPLGSRIQVSKSITGGVSLLILSSSSTEYATSKTILEGEARADFESVTHDAKGTIENFELTLAELRALIDKIGVQVDGADVAKLSKKLDELVEGAKATVAEARRLVKDGHDPVLATIEDADKAVNKFGKLAETLKSDWSEKLEPDAHRTLKAAAEMAEDAQPKLKDILQTAKDAAAKAAETIVKIDDLAAELTDTVKEARAPLNSALRRASRAMGHFEQAAVELKTAPWKVFNKPSKSERERQYFYNAAEMYLGAAIEVRSAVDDLATLQRLGAVDENASRATVERATERLTKAVIEMEAQEAIVKKALTERK